jgi:hypothetical protein
VIGCLLVRAPAALRIQSCDGGCILQPCRRAGCRMNALNFHAPHKSTDHHVNSEMRLIMRLISRGFIPICLQATRVSLAGLAISLLARGELACDVAEHTCAKSSSCASCKFIVSTTPMSRICGSYCARLISDKKTLSECELGVPVAVVGTGVGSSCCCCCCCCCCCIGVRALGTKPAVGFSVVCTGDCW